MDCSDTRRLLTLERREPGLDSSVAEGTARHVEHCPACRAWDRGERRFDAAMSVAMKRVAVPAGLDRVIVARLTRGGSWSRVVWAAIAAAVLLTGVAAGYFAWPKHSDVGTYPEDVRNYQ